MLNALKEKSPYDPTKYFLGTGGGPAGFSTKGILGSAGKFSPMGITAGITAASALAAAGLDSENPNEMPRNTEALKSYLRQGYLTLNPQAETNEVEEFVEANTVEVENHHQQDDFIVSFGNESDKLG